jgi:hypothetical protein
MLVHFYILAFQISNQVRVYFVLIRMMHYGINCYYE